MALSRRTGRSRFTLLLLVLTSVTVITLDFRGQGSGVIEGAREVALDVFSPVKGAADAVFSPVGNAWNGVFNYDELEEENERLKEQLTEVEGDEARAEAAVGDLAALKEQQGLDWARGLGQVDAEVVNTPISNFEFSFEIDAGGKDGVKEGMPVVAGRGLVGKVVQVTPRHSKVELLTDREFAVGVRMVSSKDVGIANGGGKDEPLAVESIDPETTVERGELAVTAGAPSVFPPNIPVGKVRSARAERGELQQAIELTPMVDTDRLRFVKVLLWEPPV